MTAPTTESTTATTTETGPTADTTTATTQTASPPAPSTGSKATIGELLASYGVSDADKAVVLGRVERANSEAARYRTERNTLRTQVADLATITAERDAAVGEVTKTRTNLVESEVKRLAADRFADERDALGTVKAEDFLTAEGAVDVTKLTEHLDGVLTDRPHWAKPTGSKPGPKPLPNQGQSAGGGATPEQLATDALKNGDVRKSVRLKSDQLAGLMRQTPSS